MNIHSLTQASNVAAAATADPQNEQRSKSGTQADADQTGDTVVISAQGLAKSAASGKTAVSSGDNSNLASRITKLQKQLQQLQGNSSLPEDKKRSEMATLRNQIQMLQSQQPKSGGSTAATLATSHA